MSAEPKPVCKKVFVGKWSMTYEVLLDGEKIGLVVGTRHNAKNVLWQGVMDGVEVPSTLSTTRRDTVAWMVDHHLGRPKGYWRAT